MGIFSRTINYLFKFDGDSSGAVQATEEVRKSTEEVGKTADEVTITIDKGMRRAEAATTSLVGAVNSVGSSLVSIASSWISINNTQDLLIIAQERYNDAVKKYGEESLQARAAAVNVENANRRLYISYAMLAVQGFHLVSTLMTLAKTYTLYTDATTAASKATAIFGFNLKVALGAAGVLALIIAAMMVDSEGLRYVLIGLASALAAATAWQWAMNNAMSFGLGLTVAGFAAVGTAAAAMAVSTGLQESATVDVEKDLQASIDGLNKTISGRPAGTTTVVVELNGAKVDLETIDETLNIIGRRLEQSLGSRACGYGGDY